MCAWMQLIGVESICTHICKCSWKQDHTQMVMVLKHCYTRISRILRSLRETLSLTEALSDPPGGRHCIAQSRAGSAECSKLAVKSMCPRAQAADHTKSSWIRPPCWKSHPLIRSLLLLHDPWIPGRPKLLLSSCRESATLLPWGSEINLCVVVRPW